jgi:Nitrile hydratase, alpha chain
MRSREQIMARAAEDAAFRQQLKSDPRGTLEREIGGSLPPDVKISVMEETPKQVFLVLPAAGSKELTTDELAGVAGGGCWIGASNGCYFVTSA